MREGLSPHTYSAVLDYFRVRPCVLAQAMKAALEETNKKMEENDGPSTARAWQELDAKRIAYTNELEWLEQQDKENVANGRRAMPMSKEFSQARLDEEESKAHKASTALDKKRELLSMIQEELAPLEQRASTLRSAVADLKSEAGEAGLAEGFQKDEMICWYTGMRNETKQSTCGIADPSDCRSFEGIDCIRWRSADVNFSRQCATDTAHVSPQ